MSDDGFNLRDAIDGSAPVETFKTVLGLRQEAHVCPECHVACEPSETYNTQTAAFDGSACPSWECPECGAHYVRDTSEESHAMDLYGRD